MAVDEQEFYSTKIMLRKLTRLLPYLALEGGKM
jgi:hypothetical protein